MSSSPVIVKGSSLGILGDLHIDDRYRGRHKNYQDEVNQTLAVVKDFGTRHKLDVFASTGDIFGVRPQVSRVDNRDVLFRTIDTFRSAAGITVLNTGNHDIMGRVDKNDYLLLDRLGVVKTPISLSTEGNSAFEDAVARVSESGTGIVRERGNRLPVGCFILEHPVTNQRVAVHLVPFGADHEPLEPVEGAFNVAITHGDFHVGNLVRPFSPVSIDLITHEPFFGMDLVVNGHIHQPTPRVSFTTVSGCRVSFINLGAVPRVTVKEKHTHALGIVVSLGDNGDVTVREDAIELSNPADLFLDKAVTHAALRDDASEVLSLDGILSVLREFSWSGSSVRERLETVPLEPAVRAMILSYLEN